MKDPGCVNLMTNVKQIFYEKDGITPGRSDYVLLNSLRSDCSRDSRFKELLSIDE